MAYLEQTGSLISLSQQLDEVYRHYSSQLIQQFHVLVLGLDVLGNPYGLITDFTEGFGDFFYEPYLVSLQFRYGSVCTDCSSDGKWPLRRLRIC
jgi:vacuolar protein sorting-associated protein 13A/C